MFQKQAFGANTSGFVSFGAAPGGTALVKYAPLVGTDEVMKCRRWQVTKIKHQCITLMKEYESKSLEELRLEDYEAGRKPSTENRSLFGSNQTAENKPLFGSNQPADNKPLFGSNQPAENKLMFGFGQPSENKPLFGSNQPAENKLMFGFDKPSENKLMFGFDKPSENKSLFGSNQPTENKLLFGFDKPSENKPLFGSNQPTENKLLFGAQASSGWFGVPSTKAPMFPKFTAFESAGGGLVADKPPSFAFGPLPPAGAKAPSPEFRSTRDGWSLSRAPLVRKR